MQLIQSLATAALAFVAAAAPALVARDAFTELPGRFALYLVTDSPSINGLRIQATNSWFYIKTSGSNMPAADGIFSGGRGRIALYRPNSDPIGGDWNLIFFGGVSQLQISNETSQAVLSSWGPGSQFTVGHFVQDGNGLVRLLDAKGVVQPNGLKICGEGPGEHQFWWDDVPYMPCPEAKLRVVAL